MSQESDIKTALRQARAVLVAEFACKQRLERIEWEERVLRPELQKLERSASVKELPQFTIHDEDN